MEKKDPAHRRPDILERAPLHYASQNELGVVFLFSGMTKKLRLKIEEIRPQFPDCIAYQKTGGGEKEIRIEFEFKSRNFRPHLSSQEYKTNGCDWIVCWEDNWPDKPKNLKIIELRKEFGLGFNVWIQPVSGKEGEKLSETNSSDSWSVPSLARKDDLILYYHTHKKKYIKDIFKLFGDVEIIQGTDWAPYFGPIRRVCELKSPIFFEDLKRDRFLKTASFVRGTMRGRPKATEYWPYLFDMIIRRNPSLKKVLAKYDPEKI
jgi:hypothetical protein